jgi:hypothetical protein
MNIAWTQTAEERPARRLFTAADISRTLSSLAIKLDEIA